MKPEVSIICKTYNHENYIEDTISSFIEQKTTFPFEVIIHDDASLDKTPIIINKLKEKHPNIIKVIHQQQNTYNNGINTDKINIYPEVSGKYIAFCEGDDFWTDTDKLQKQYEFMELNSDYTLCFHGVQIINNRKEKILNRTIGPIGGGNQEFKLYDVGKSGFIHISSMFLKADLLKHDIPEWVYFIKGGIGGDLKIAIYSALKGRVYYIDQIMSSYRIGVNNSLMDRMRKSYSVDMKLEYEKLIIRLLEEIKENSDSRNLNELEKLIRYYKFRALKTQFPKSRKELISEYSEYYAKISLADKIKLILKRYLPKSSRMIITIIRRLKNE